MTWPYALTMGSRAVLLLLAGCAAWGCDANGPARKPVASASAKASASAAGSAEVAPKVPPANRSGSAALLADEKTLVIADEDHAALWQLPVPLAADVAPTRLAMPGPPAALIVAGDRLLVTIRNPGLLVALERDGTTWKEAARTALADDAWGVALTADGTRALVTSAWTRRVAAVDLATMKVAWQLDVAREPRAVIPLAAGDRAYVTHLVGSDVTRIDGIGGDAPKITRVTLPAARSLAPRGEAIDASLAYAAVLSPDEARLFVPRHALGALGQHLGGEPTWFGAATVDVLLTKSDEPLAPERNARAGIARFSDYAPEEGIAASFGAAVTPAIDGPEAPLAMSEATPFVQPRAAAYRATTSTLLVASEGGDELVEIDALSLEPARHRIHRYRLGAGYVFGMNTKFGVDTLIASSGAAPTAIALSKDESTAYVWCRASYDVLAVPLVGVSELSDEKLPVAAKLADDPLLDGVDGKDPKRKFREAAALGRRMFYNAIDDTVSGGLGCAGCHPEGRDDGHVWRQTAIVQNFDETQHDIFVGGAGQLAQFAELPASFMTRAFKLVGPSRARQTPLLAGRIANGPYGWLGENKTVGDRLKAGFRLHRWTPHDADPMGDPAEHRALALHAFLSAGLVTPPRPSREPSAEEKRGRELFNSNEVGCSSCHLPDSDYMNRATAKLALPVRKGYADESAAEFKVPSLRFVGGTAPYFHDGSVPTLDELIVQNPAHMGSTKKLSSADQQALIAFVRSL